MPGGVPAYRTQEFAAKQHKYCICIFVINEGERIRRQLASLAAHHALVDIIIADGGSTDGSLDEAYLTQCHVRALLTKTGPGALSAQMRMAFDYALREGYEGVIVADGNGKDDMEAVPRFAAALQQRFDHVQGSRYIKGGVGENTPFTRHWGVRLLHAPLISLAAGRRCTDTTNGFRAYSRTLLMHPQVQPFRDIFSHYELHYYLAIRAARLGMNTTEIPVTRRYPPQGKTPTKISPLKGNLRILRTLANAVLGRYNPTP